MTFMRLSLRCLASQHRMDNLDFYGQKMDDDGPIGRDASPFVHNRSFLSIILNVFQCFQGVRISQPLGVIKSVCSH